MVNNYISDIQNTYDYALKKILEWGYDVFMVDESECLCDGVYYCAKKDNKVYLETTPTRLLGLLTIIEKYGEYWEKRKSVPHCYSLHLIEEK